MWFLFYLLSSLQFFFFLADGADVGDIVADFSGQIRQLSCKYLGLPLGYRNARKVSVNYYLTEFLGDASSGKQI